MYYAARIFGMKMGQSIAMILFASIAILRQNGLGYRLTVLASTVFCLVGGLIFLRYNEGSVLKVLGKGDGNEAQGADQA